MATLQDKLTPKTCLVIVAHPDDIEYFCAGTLRKWIKDGCHVCCVVTSSGEKGNNDITIDANEFIRIREMEQVESAKVLGIQSDDIMFLHYPDSELSFVDSNILREEFVRQIRRTKPEIILTHDPLVRTIRQHPDHRFVGQIAFDASFPISVVAQCYSKQITEEGLSPHQAMYVLLFGTDQPNLAIDISDTLTDKVLALKQHVSQEGAFSGGIEKRLEWKSRSIGQKYGLKHAEEFLLVRVGATPPESDAFDPQVKMD